MKQLEVQIMGQSYLLGCPEGGEVRLLEAVEKVDTAMCRIRDAGKIKARERIAVLAALNLAFDLGEPSATQASAGSDAPVPVSVTSPSVAPLAAVPAPAADAAAPQLPDARLAQVLQRLEQALGNDGRLI